MIILPAAVRDGVRADLRGHPHGFFARPPSSLGPRRAVRREESDCHREMCRRSAQATTLRRRCGARSNAIVRNTRPPSRMGLRLLFP
jgi:hypothetical protein